MKRKTLLAMAVALLCSVGSWATDAYQSYLTPAKGWTQVSDLSSMTLSDYYFAIVCKDNTDLMVKIDKAKSGQQNNNHSMWYADAKDPIKENSYLWILENNNTEGYVGYTIRNVDRPVRVLQTNENNPWYCRTNWEMSSARWTSYDFELSDGKYSIKALANGGTNYLGLWDPANGYVNGQELAGNKSGSDIGSFLLYSIPKTTANTAIAAASGASASASYDLAPSLFGRYTSDYTGATGYYGDYRYLESYADNVAPSTGDKITKSITGAPNGYHLITVIANAAWISGRGVVGTEVPTTNDNSTVVTINGVSKNVPVRTDGSYNPVTLTFPTVVKDGNISFAITNNDAAAFWFVWDITDTYMGVGLDYKFSEIGSAPTYTSYGSAPTGGHTYVLYNETGKFLYNDGVTPRVSGSNATFYALEATGSEFYIRSDAGLLYKQSNSNWNTWTNGDYGDVAKWSTTLNDGKYKIQNHNKAANNYYFAPNSNGEGIQCYSDKTSLTGWYFIDVTDNRLAVSLLYELQQAKANYYDVAVDAASKTTLGIALDDVYVKYVMASSFTSDDYLYGVAAIEDAINAYWEDRFAEIDGSEGGEDITSWITNPTPTSNGDGWIRSQEPAYSSGNNVAEFWNKSGASISQAISLPSGYYRLTAIALTRTGMVSTLAATGATSGALNSMSITTVSSGIANNLEQANTWFNAGYGVNELDFYVPSQQNVTISLTADNTTGDHWTVWRSFQLTAVGSSEGNLLNLEEYLDDSALAAANTVKNDAIYAHVSGSEKTNFVNAINALNDYDEEGTIAEKVADRKTLKYAIVASKNAFVAAKQNYDEYYYENETATRLGSDVSAVSAPTTSAEASTAAHVINIINYEYLEEREYEDVSATVLGAWTDDNVKSEKGQHYDGTGSSTYFEQNSGWSSATVWSMSRQQTVRLSAGTYVLKVAARVASGADAELSVKVGSADPIVTYVGHHGDVGLGITTSGEACYISHDIDDTKVYANENNGRGFEWRYIPFTLASDDDVTLKFYAVNNSGKKYQFVSFTSLGIWCDPAVAAKTDLLTAISNATTIYNGGANVGSGVFQIPTAAATTFTDAIDAAQDVYDDGAATKSEVTSATSTLNAAITTFQTTVNAPSSSTRYKLTLAGRGALSYQTASTEGGYGMPFTPPADYMAQTVFLTQVSGNTYTMSFEDFDGTTRYFCTRAKYGEGGTGTAGIRSTTNAEDALIIKIKALPTAGNFQMLNSERDDEELGSNGGDFYTASNYSTWSIAEASQASVTVSAKAGKYGTVIFPFTPDVSTGFDDITFYSCAEINDETNNVLMEEVPEPTANKPYLVKNASGSNFNKALTGWGLATTDNYTEGMLTGTYTAATIAASVEPTASDAGSYRYVLQTPTSGANEGIQAFYKVASDFTSTAYKCYLTVPVAATGGGEVKAFYLDFGDETATAINAVEAAQNESAVIYNLAGQRLSKTQKGVNIINGKKVLVK